MAFTQTITGTPNGDEIAGADEGDDFIFGRGGNDQLTGFGRHDYLFGGSGDDRLFGEKGNDVLIGGSGADHLDGGQGFDIADYSDSGGAIHVTLSGGEGTGKGAAARGDVLAGIEGIYGSEFGDTLTGGVGAQTLVGRGGDDLLGGGNHADILDGGDGDDRVYGETGDDLIQGGAGADILDGGAGFDMAAYYGGAVLIDMLRPGRNTGNGAGDVLNAIEGLYGSDLDDTLLGDDGGNRLNGNGGGDVLRGRGGDDILRGGGADDVMNGGDGDDVFEGGGAVLNGGAGNDILNVQLGSFVEYQGQRMWGGEGADVFNTSIVDSTSVRILDFEPGVDSLRFFQGSGPLPEGQLDPASFVLGTTAAEADDRIIYDPGTGRLWFDQDGSGEASAILVAVLTNHAPLSAADIVV